MEIVVEKRLGAAVRLLRLSLGLLLLLLPALCSSPVFPTHPSFLPQTFRARGPDGEKQHFYIRQVPGDGACLFHAVAVCLRHKESLGCHPDFDAEMEKLSRRLRKISVSYLSRDNCTLVMEGDERTTTTSLLQTVAEHYNMTPERYCGQMRLTHTWGGGPEIVAISNFLRRPIHVYELESTTSSGLGYLSGRRCFQLKVTACFGAPYFNDKSPLYLLCADGRFPHIDPGDEREIGDHFLALLPCGDSSLRRRVIRGGVRGKDQEKEKEKEKEEEGRQSTSASSSSSAAAAPSAASASIDDGHSAPPHGGGRALDNPTTTTNNPNTASSSSSSTLVDSYYKAYDSYWRGWSTGPLLRGGLREKFEKFRKLPFLFRNLDFGLRGKMAAEAGGLDNVGALERAPVSSQDTSHMHMHRLAPAPALAHTHTRSNTWGDEEDGTTYDTKTGAAGAAGAAESAESASAQSGDSGSLQGLPHTQSSASSHSHQGSGGGGSSTSTSSGTSSSSSTSSSHGGSVGSSEDRSASEGSASTTGETSRLSGRELASQTISSSSASSKNMGIGFNSSRKLGTGASGPVEDNGITRSYFDLEASLAELLVLDEDEPLELE